ncbi:MAG: phospho-N-acetylmuramoyl-pentapeptide-transferase [Flavobacteriaceae bacterium]|nr:phospho-N-acetylmuramoyl-pentapeptide-transferase [Flavobacteriaceae bacterium]
MLYNLFEYLENQYQFPGASLFQFISFRAALSVLFALMLSTIFGKKIIEYLKRKQIGESVRELGLEGQSEKSGTPTMGGVIIIMSTLIPVLLIAQLQNIYILLLIFTTVWMGSIGFLDDYIKVFRKDKAGLKGFFKIIGQVILGIVVGLTLYFHSEVVVRIEQSSPQFEHGIEGFTKDDKSTITTIPFLKNNEFDYALLIDWIPNSTPYAWIVFVPFVVFIVTAFSNGANLTDGIDGLAAGSSAIMVFTLGIFAWVSGNVIFSDYLNVMYIPNAGEITIFVASFLGALIGFLWYNTFPAQVFMGDTGSLTIGAIIAVIALMIRKELLLPLLCGIFVIENLSVVLQVGYFKYTRKKYGEGKRIFLMAPLHHHYQKLGYHESKIVSRFWIIGILLSVLTIVTLKIR